MPVLVFCPGAKNHVGRAEETRNRAFSHPHDCTRNPKTNQDVSTGCKNAGVWSACGTPATRRVWSIRATRGVAGGCDALVAQQRTDARRRRRLGIRVRCQGAEGLLVPHVHRHVHERHNQHDRCDRKEREGRPEEPAAGKRANLAVSPGTQTAPSTNSWRAAFRQTPEPRRAAMERLYGAACMATRMVPYASRGRAGRASFPPTYGHWCHSTRLNAPPKEPS